MTHRCFSPAMTVPALSVDDLVDGRNLLVGAIAGVMYFTRSIDW